MKTRVARWGNSLALRIPSGLAFSYDLTEGTNVEIIEDNGDLKLRPVVADALKLDDLLSLVTDENRQDAIETGSIEGKETW